MPSAAKAQTTGASSNASNSISHGYAWVPPGLTRLQVNAEIQFY